MSKLILTLLIFFRLSSVNGQITTQTYIDQEFKEENFFKDELSFQSYLRHVKFQLVDRGYFFSGIDSVISSDSIRYIYFYQGDEYYKLLIDGKKTKRPSYFFKSTLDQYTNSGYPFASIRLSALNINSSKKELNASIAVREGPLIKYDSIYFKSELKVSKAYIANLLDLRFGYPFKEATFNSIETKIKRSEILRLNAQPEISFKDGKAKIYLDLNETNANSFDGIIGLQQNNNARSILVGNLDLRLGNLFRSEKKLDLHWSRFEESSQSLELSYLHPYIFGSDISPSVSFGLLKQDTIFLSNTFELSFFTHTNSGIKLNFGFAGQSSSLLTTDLDLIIQNDLIDYSTTTYIAGIEKGILTRDIFSDFFKWKLKLGLGNRNIQDNVNLPDEYYDSLTFDRNIFNGEASFAFQKIVNGPSAFFWNVNGGFIINNSLFQNELFRLGGLSTVRGFNELQFFASEYVYSNFEYRLYFESKSFIFFFYDQLVYGNSDQTDVPIGIGTGLTLATQSGQFKFVIGVGKSKDLPFNVSNSKIHFGYTSSF